jgi:hypothetical protein
MMAFSGSVDGNSGTEINPAPRLRRVLRDVLPRVDRRTPLLPRATGEEPVAVDTAEEPRRDVALVLTAASPQTLQ